MKSVAGHMSKRVMLTLADSVYADLEAWAASQGRPVASLANFLVEREVEKAKESGNIPPVQTGESLPQPKKGGKRKDGNS